MNKLMGFYELKDINIPTIPWKLFSPNVKLADNLLWTLRVAVENSNDLNLPRVVGANSSDAYEKGKELFNRYQNNGMVIYYPYFFAEKSGVLEVTNDRIVIEAVDRDLWNLVTYGKKDVTIIIQNSFNEYIGNEDFLRDTEVSTLIRYAHIIKYKYRDILHEGKSIFAEWSFARNSDINNKPVGDTYLVFYELRSVV